MKMPFLAALVCGASVAMVALAQEGIRVVGKGADASRDVDGIRTVGVSPRAATVGRDAGAAPGRESPGADAKPSGTLRMASGLDVTPVMAPVGAVVAWVKSMPGTPALPPGWVECNGQIVGDPKSPYHGQSTPDLNGATGTEKRFLRGSSISGAVGGTETHDHGIYRSQKYGTQRLPVMGPSTANHLPPFYEVVWIMRVK